MLDMKTRKEKLEKKRRQAQQKELMMQEIFKNTPYAFEACRFDRIINP
jgi:hypothetical protein